MLTTFDTICFTIIGITFCIVTVFDAMHGFQLGIWFNLLLAFTGLVTFFLPLIMQSIEE